MSSFEDRLLTSLSADDEAFLKELEDDVGLIQQMGSIFSGPLKYWTAFAFAQSFVFVGISIWALIEMFQATSLKMLVLWFSLFFGTMLAVSMIKIWIWMRMNHLGVLRELKRIELRLVKAG
ncbi:MAG: DUF6768 family protein [Pseudomonadota bacterium]